MYVLRFFFSFLWLLLLLLVYISGKKAMDNTSAHLEFDKKVEKLLFIETLSNIFLLFFLSFFSLFIYKYCDLIQGFLSEICDVN